MAQSIVDDYKQGGTLTKWGMDNGETYIMVGDSGGPVLADYYAFGATGFDTATALSAMVTEQTTDTTVTPGVTYLDSFGYLPTNSIYGCCHEYATTSTQLEYDTDDFALSAFAAGARRQPGRVDLPEPGAGLGEHLQQPPAATSSPGTPTAAGWTASPPSLITGTASNDFAEGDALHLHPG